MNIVSAILGVIVGFLLFGFWIKMLSDVFTNQPTETKVGWALFLFFCNFPAAIFYYFNQYRPRTKKATHNNKVIVKEVKQVNTAIKFCSNCGTKLDAKANYCPSCGKKLTY